MIPLMPTISSAIDQHRAGACRRRQLELDHAEQARRAHSAIAPSSAPLLLQRL